jgi:gliding motility-associated-like protein
LFNLGAGNYTVTVVDSFGCILNDVTIISQPDSLQLTIYSPLQFNGHHVSLAGSNDGLIDLTVNGGTNPFTYLWSNGTTTEDLNNITAGFYNVIVIDTNGCKASASITLTEPFVLELPTGFSPNGDGKNDLFVIHGIESYPDNTVTIYNRWGNVVYSTAGYTNDWNGNSNNGQALPDATYFVILEINKGEIVKKNYVELRR